jgi:sirohydrochlorin ferrochelatase
MGNRTVSRLFAELALAGGVRADSAARELDRWLSTDRSYVAFVLPWWSERGDTESIARSLREARALLRGPRGTSTWNRAAYDSAAALAYLTLERRDGSALQHFLRLPDTLCLGCFDLDRLKTAQLLASREGLREARHIAEEWRGAWVMPSDVLFALELGRVTEHLGDRDAAIAAYRVVIESWSGADAVLQPVVAEARDAIRRLTGDAARGRPLATRDTAPSHPR